MALRIVRAGRYDLRFPTSRSGAGSDAVNPDPDYSTAYVALETHDSGLSGRGLSFTIDRAEVCVAAIDGLAPRVVVRSSRKLVVDLGGLGRRLLAGTQLRWLGLEQGVSQLATAAVVNAVRDLNQKLEGERLWNPLADLSPEQIVACVDFR